MTPGAVVRKKSRLPKERKLCSCQSHDAPSFTRLPFQERVVPENPAVNRSSGPERHQFQRHWLLVWFQFVWVCSDVIGQAWSSGRVRGWASVFAGGVINADSDWSRQGQLTSGG